MAAPEQVLLVPVRHRLGQGQTRLGADRYTSRGRSAPGDAGNLRQPAAAHDDRGNSGARPKPHTAPGTATPTAEAGRVRVMRRSRGCRATTQTGQQRHRPRVPGSAGAISPRRRPGRRRLRKIASSPRPIRPGCMGVVASSVNHWVRWPSGDGKTPTLITGAAWRGGPTCGRQPGHGSSGVPTPRQGLPSSRVFHMCRSPTGDREGTPSVPLL